MSSAHFQSKNSTRQSIHPLSKSEQNSETEERKREIFDNIIKEKLGDAMKIPNEPLPSAFIYYFDSDLYPPAINEVDEYPVQTDGTTVFEHPIIDHWIHTEPNLPQGE